MFEKYLFWTNFNNRNLPDGGLSDMHINVDTIYDNLMIYILSNSITTSLRIFPEAFSNQQENYFMDYVPVNSSIPVCCLHFKTDYVSQQYVQYCRKYPNSRPSILLDGGHFAALENFENIYKTLKIFFK